MKYKLLKAQKEFIEVPHDYSLDVSVYQGGFGSGKTFAGSLLGILLCLKYPKIKGLVGAQTFPLVRDTTLATYFEHLENMGFKENIDFSYSKTEQKLMFKNGSSIIFRHFDEPNKLKSLNLGFAQIEEMSDVPEATFKMILGRLRQHKQKSWNNFCYRLFGHTNPESRRGWIYKTFVQFKKPNYRIIIAPTTENIYLPKGYCDELKKIYDKKYYQSNVLGIWSDYDKSFVVKDFGEDNIRDIAYNKSLPLHLSCDFNVDPMSWILAHKTQDKAFFFDELVIEGTTTAKSIDEFCRRYPDHQSEIIINGDASGDNRSCTSEYTNYMIMKKQLAQHGYKNVQIQIRPYNPPIKNRIIAFNAKIRNACGEATIFISPKCEKLIYNLNNLKYKEGTSLLDLPSHYQIKNDSNLKFLGHIFDASSYLIEFYWPLG
ncbi:MAG: phage terminase large subunit [Sulfurospirillaceae bacterium]|nr:phage terminase large subunit [Sulfurospirillaceae bacterium]